MKTSKLLNFSPEPLKLPSQLDSGINDNKCLESKGSMWMARCGSLGRLEPAKGHTVRTCLKREKWRGGERGTDTVK